MKIAGLDLSISSSGCVVMELDDQFNVVDVIRHGFCNTKKQAMTSPDLTYYNIKDFKNHYDRYQFFADNILEWVKDCDIISVEDYAYDSKGFVFDLAEFEGNIKMSLYRMKKSLRFYPPMSNKKFWSKVGNAGKIRMYDTYLDFSGKKFDISDLPIVTDDKKGAMPTSDIVDAFALCEFLRYELLLKNGLILLKDLPKHQIECFNTITKEHPTGFLGSGWDIDFT